MKFRKLIDLCGTEIRPVADRPAIKIIVLTLVLIPASRQMCSVNFTDSTSGNFGWQTIAENGDLGPLGRHLVRDSYQGRIVKQVYRKANYSVMICP